ncbi:hypothetical protein ACLKA6_019813 [Drosophila palustris]
MRWYSVFAPNSYLRRIFGQGTAELELRLELRKRVNDAAQTSLITDAVITIMDTSAFNQTVGPTSYESLNKF